MRLLHESYEPVPRDNLPQSGKRLPDHLRFCADCGGPLSPVIRECLAGVCRLSPKRRCSTCAQIHLENEHEGANALTESSDTRTFDSSASLTGEGV